MKASARQVRQQPLWEYQTAFVGQPGEGPSPELPPSPPHRTARSYASPHPASSSASTIPTGPQTRSHSAAAPPPAIPPAPREARGAGGGAAVPPSRRLLCGLWHLWRRRQRRGCRRGREEWRAGSGGTRPPWPHGGGAQPGAAADPAIETPGVGAGRARGIQSPGGGGGATVPARSGPHGQDAGRSAMCHAPHTPPADSLLKPHQLHSPPAGLPHSYRTPAT